jgi:enoyl-[acyl-carrier protein] reductase II
MIWCSGAKLAAAVSKAGGFGLVGAASMAPDLFRSHIRKARILTDRPVGVNIPLLSPLSEEQVAVAIEEHVPVVFTSAGSPKHFTGRLREAGATVFHVVSSPVHATKCEQAGVDGVVAEGFEAGGHNGREELTTMVLTPQVVASVSCPVIAAGGIGTGKQIVAAMALGADGVQIGTRFALTQESSAHPAFKQACIEAGPDATMLLVKKGAPVRLMKNAFRDRLAEAESRGADLEELLELIGQSRSCRGMFEGDLDEGELEIGQVTGMINDLPTAGDVIRSMVDEYDSVRRALPPLTS